jgi:hypothetical protein
MELVRPDLNPRPAGPVWLAIHQTPPENAERRHNDSESEKGQKNRLGIVLEYTMPGIGYSVLLPATSSLAVWVGGGGSGAARRLASFQCLRSGVGNIGWEGYGYGWGSVSGRWSEILLRWLAWRGRGLFHGMKWKDVTLLDGSWRTTKSGQ